MERMNVPISEKYNLTINESAAYFNIGVKRLRRLVAEHPGEFTINCGTKQLIVRHKLESFLDGVQEV